MKCIGAEIIYGPYLVKRRTHAGYSMYMYRLDNEHVLERAYMLKSENKVISHVGAGRLPLCVQDESRFHAN